MLSSNPFQMADYLIAAEQVEAQYLDQCSSRILGRSESSFTQHLRCFLPLADKR
jgi:hypothetical protein